MIFLISYFRHIISLFIILLNIKLGSSSYPFNIQISAHQNNVFSIYKASQGNWFNQLVSNPGVCLFSNTGQIQFSSQDIHKFYRFTFIVYYRAQTCNEQIIFTRNSNNLDFSHVFINNCYVNYHVSLNITTDLYISSQNNNFELQIIKTITDSCSLTGSQQTPSLSDQSYVIKIYFQNLINNFCPEATNQSNLKNCYSCLNSQNRYLVNNDCQCNQGYFQSKQNLICLACKPSCLTCNNQSQCTACFENATLKQNQCICNEGYFMNDSYQCQKCNLPCKTCVFSQNYCTSCIDLLQILPNCQCPPKMYFDPTPSALSCKVCDTQCQTCQYNPAKASKNQCTSCLPGFINPPFCQQECSDVQVYDYTQNQCIPLQCDNKCLTCSKHSSNCQQCKGDRKNPPYCQCDRFLFEDGVSTNCIKCPEGQFLDINDNSNKGCQPCHYSCKRCTGPNKFDCTDCYSDEFVRTYDGRCACVDNTKTQIMDELNKNKPICMNRLDMNLTIYINKSFKQIFRIEFSDQLIQSVSLDQAVNNLVIYLQYSSPQEYQMIPTFYNNKYIEFCISTKKVIPRQFLYVYAAEQHIFQGVNKSILDLKYLQKPLSVYLVQEEVNSQNNLQNLQQLKAASQSVQNNFFVQFVTKYYFFLFILSTLQPTILFLIVPIEFPLNIQLYLKIVGQFVFSHNQFFSSYEEQGNDYTKQNQYYIFSFDLTDELKNSIPENEQFYQIGFLNNFFYNTQVPSLLFIIFLSVYWILRLIHKFLDTKDQNDLKMSILLYRELNFQNFGQTQYFELIEQYNKMINPNQNNQNQPFILNQQSQTNITQKIYNITVLLNNQLLSNFESNFVLYLISIYLQFYNFQDSVYINRVSIYIMFAFIFQAIYIQVRAYHYMKQNQFDKVPMFADRLKNKNSKYYFHFYSLILKLIISICAIFSSKTFNLNISIIILTQIMLLAYIFYYRPFKSIIYMIIKVLGTLSFLASWVCVLTIGIIKSRFDQNNLMTDSDQQTLNKIGIAMMVTLSLFNGLYLLSFFLDIFITIKQLIFKCFGSKNKKFDTIHIVDNQNICIELHNTRNLNLTDIQFLPYLSKYELKQTDDAQNENSPNELKNPLVFQQKFSTIKLNKQ
ncbi:transmembrane protein, putative (macronuclear) [Tetrahymena thermophila SB210]|uniref:Transmembrane protein, putative n=1 Tax=Tetrahymena thermophila (strain SB210) TaxID=312017 RepID=I7MDC1_TETTS|nr:transmembrane protein, putative [Tetrahymena thermophila SB210]EAR87302.2 transmembrane protein, putative [Tetrahymena thermophila SB210]|eukprot:XP_001007547.2 transmembrane protein, putative [Tetrahymena thermophila SB210]